MNLNVVDLAVASLVCKMWNKACHDPSLWRKIDLSELNNSYLFNIQNNKPGAYKHSRGKITQFLKYVLSLSNGNTNCLIFNYNVDLTDEQFIIAAERTPNLKRLVLPKTCVFSRKAVHTAMKSWGGLESITISFDDPNKYIFSAIAKYCKNITEMKFSHGCLLFEENYVKALLKCAPNLKALSIRCIMTSMGALCGVFTSFQHLEAVNICHSSIIDAPYSDFGVVDITYVQKHLPPSNYGKLIYCKEGSCLRCKNDRSIIPAGIFQITSILIHASEDLWREDEITSLAH
uniref:F-box domain-containing protein n=2 Tax=Glycine max TaxID=3847 RepID=K7K2Y5_SOYBN